MHKITVSGRVIPAFDPIEFPGATAIDPRVTDRRDATKGKRRSNGRTRIISRTYSSDAITEAERNRRFYCRDW